jgi:hypothetical protein
MHLGMFSGGFGATAICRRKSTEPVLLGPPGSLLSSRPRQAARKIEFPQPHQADSTGPVLSRKINRFAKR